jgi:hypothetical protein
MLVLRILKYFSKTCDKSFHSTLAWIAFPCPWFVPWRALAQHYKSFFLHLFDSWNGVGRDCLDAGTVHGSISIATRRHLDVPLKACTTIYSTLSTLPRLDRLTLNCKRILSAREGDATVLSRFCPRSKQTRWTF